MGLVINMTHSNVSQRVLRKKGRKKGGKRANKTNKLFNEWLKSKYGRILGEQILAYFFNMKTFSTSSSIRFSNSSIFLSNLSRKL